MVIMSIWSQISCSITNPLIITHKNNPAIIEFYLNIHELGVRRAGNLIKLTEMYFLKT